MPETIENSEDDKEYQSKEYIRLWAKYEPYEAYKKQRRYDHYEERIGLETYKRNKRNGN